jgi:hypothetical protein
VSSDLAAIHGSTLGVVIDARGRPLRLPEDAHARQQALWSWLMALGIEREPLPYPALDSVVEASLPVLTAPVIPAPLRPGESRPTTEMPVASGSIESDLAKLRQTVEEPKKRGFFRRK